MHQSLKKNEVHSEENIKDCIWGDVNNNKELVLYKKVGLA